MENAGTQAKGAKHAGAHVQYQGAGLTYSDGAEALDACCDLTFSVEPGQSVALIGPSGCGKSTTLHLAVGLIAPTEGSVLVNGQTLKSPREETAFIPQDLGLFPWKTVLQNATLGLRLHGMSKPEAIEKARAALAQVGLADFQNSYPKELSGGMRQRLALARALAMEVDLLLMDEPLSAIDALLRESLQDALLDLWVTRGHTQMFVTHSIEEAVYLGQRILVFCNRPGTVVAELANDGVGQAGWRETPQFAATCARVREALAEAMR